MRKDILIFRTSLIVLVVTLIFTYGYLVAKNKYPPHETMSQIHTAISSFLNFGEVVPLNRLHKAPDGASREVFSIHNKAKLLAGYYVVAGWDHSRKAYSVWLYDHAGDLKHSWVMNYWEYDEDGPSNGTEAPHGFKLLADGSILVNHDRGDILTRIDSCGKAVWTKEGVFHHSIEEAEDGTYWTWEAKDTAYSHYQYLINFDARDGSTIKRIGLVEDVIANLPPGSPEFLIRPDFPFDNKLVQAGSSRDLFHPNDVEPLFSKDAENFQDFVAGDLLISLRNLNMVAVLSSEDYTVKWAAYGPWRLQHDPDFTSDGKISVYNNNSRLKRSEVYRIDPTSGDIENPFRDGELRFYSYAMGKHQLLPDGGTLVVVPGEGRILVVDAIGDLVLEINNLASDEAKFNAHVSNGLWLPEDYFDTLPSCD